MGDLQIGCRAEVCREPLANVLDGDAVTFVT